MKRVTITDVAKQAGVSISTASKALSGTGKLNFETINKIISCAEEIGYIPNRAAQMLSHYVLYILHLFVQRANFW